MRATRSEKTPRFPFSVRLKRRSPVLPEPANSVGDDALPSGVSQYSTDVKFASKLFFYSLFLFNRIYCQTDVTIQVRSHPKPDRFSIIMSRPNTTSNSERHYPKSDFKNLSGLALKEWSDAPC